MHSKRALSRKFTAIKTVSGCVSLKLLLFEICNEKSKAKIKKEGWIKPNIKSPVIDGSSFPEGKWTFIASEAVVC